MAADQPRTSLCPAQNTQEKRGTFWLQMRTGPGYGDVPYGRLNNGAEVGLDCWATGDGAADNPNYRYWMRIDTGVRSGFVNDWYLDTGSPAVWQQRIPQC